jgi:hypothetical protein
MAKLASVTTMILGLIALGLLFLPSSAGSVPVLLTRAMLLVLVGLAITVARDSIGAGEVAQLLNVRVLVLLGVEGILIVVWVMWVLNVGGIRQHIRIGA